MSTITRERRETYDVEAEFTLPDVFDISPAFDHVAEWDKLHLDSVYYDTAELDLLRSSATLRRRRGAVDAGWQLKLPGREARIEVALPPNDAGVPKELRELVAGICAGRPLKRVVQLEIERDVQKVLTRDGRLVATLSDDTVSATGLDGRPVVTDWREVEVELGEAGDNALLTAIGVRLIRSGARPSPAVSKLMHALATAPESPSVQPNANAGEVVLGYLARQRSALLLGDVSVRDGADTGHAMQVACHRLRGALRVFQELFDPEVGRQLDSELSWLGGLLAAVQRRRMLRVRVASAVESLPADARLGRAGLGIDESLANEEDHYSKALIRAMHGRRYLALLGQLSEWVSAPPVTEAAAAPAPTLTSMMAATDEILAKRLRHVASSGGDPVAISQAKKATRRARYGTEALVAVFDKRQAGSRRRGYEGLQRVFGEYGDAVACAEFLLGRAYSAARSGEQTSTFIEGAVYELELHQAEKAKARAVAAARAFVRARQ